MWLKQRQLHRQGAPGCVAGAVCGSRSSNARAVRCARRRRHTDTSTYSSTDTNTTHGGTHTDTWGQERPKKGELPFYI